MAMSTACSALRNDVEKAQAYDHIPLASVQQQWSEALARYARAATDCVAALNGSPDPALLNQSSTELDAAAKAMDAATLALVNG